MDEIWTVYPKQSGLQSIAESLKIDSVLVQIMKNRGLNSEEEMGIYIGKICRTPYDNWSLRGMEQAVQCMLKQLREKKKIRVISDYDVDGITSNYVLMKGLWRAMAQVQGCSIEECQKKIDHRIPHRMLDGYGLKRKFVEQAIEDGVDCIITCDNGIAAFDALAYAKEHGITVIVTDHHEVQDKLPDADAIIDPKQKDCEYPFSEVCGAVVAYKFISCLYEVCGISKKELNEFLPYISIATVCDVMPLIDENRDIVKYGIVQIRKHYKEGTLDAGLTALIDANQLEPEKINPVAFGYILGPCLNASGRLDTAEKGLQLLLQTDSKKAQEQAMELLEINVERKDMTSEWETVAFEKIEQMPYKSQKMLFIYLPGCHESLAGIVAGHVREHTGKPTIIMTDAQEEGYMKGSGRSIPEYNMFEKCSEYKEYFVGFGGHAGAVGITMLKEHFETVREKLNENCNLSEIDIAIKKQIDLVLPSDLVTESFVKRMELLQPFGMKNPKPLFVDTKLVLERLKQVGKNKNALQFTFLNSQKERIRGIAFTTEPELFLQEVIREYKLDIEDYLDGYHTCMVPVAVLYQPEINEFNNNRTIQLLVQGMKPVKSSI